MEETRTSARAPSSPSSSPAPSDLRERLGTDDDETPEMTNVLERATDRDSHAPSHPLMSQRRNRTRVATRRASSRSRVSRRLPPRRTRPRHPRFRPRTTPLLGAWRTCPPSFPSFTATSSQRRRAAARLSSGGATSCSSRCSASSWTSRRRRAGVVSPNVCSVKRSPRTWRRARRGSKQNFARFRASSRGAWICFARLFLSYTRV